MESGTGMVIAVKRLWTLWCGLFIPGLILWMALIQLNHHGRHWFTTAFRWTAHVLVAPLALAPYTNRWIAWLDGGGPHAVAGFLLLLALWVLMVALPLTLLASWATWMGRRMGGPSTPYDSSDPYAAIPDGTLVHPATRLLYIVTIPTALVFNLVRWFRRTLGLPLAIFAGMGVLRFAYQWIQLTEGQPEKFQERMHAMLDFYNGPYLWLGFHLTPLDGQWRGAFIRSQDYIMTFYTVPGRYQDFLNHPTHYPAILWLLSWDAVLFGLMFGVVVWVLFTVGRFLAYPA